MSAEITEGTDVTEVSYSYDANGRRIGKTVERTGSNLEEITDETEYVWYGDIIYYEKHTETVTDLSGTTSSSQVMTTMYGQSGITARNDDIYATDGHGSVRRKYSQNTTDEYDYHAFGDEIDPDSTDTNPYRYCGEYTDKETGLIYLKNRYYDPSLGIFISEDPARDELNWYVYCYNNPIMLFDPFGLAPTAMEAAEIAAHIYDYDTSYLKEKRTIAGWRLIDVWNGREGMKMGIYIRDTDDWQNPSEYTIAFKGTTWYDLGDWQNNAEQLLSPKSADMWDAINYSKGFVNDHSQEITFVGHSKGGAEAASAAVATNKNAMIFNPATSNFSAYGLSSSGYTASMTAYIVKGDIVNHLEGWFSTPIDKAVYLPQQYGGHWYEAWQTSLYQRIQNHLMGAVKSALKEAGY